jgi:hypothetical protein
VTFAETYARWLLLLHTLLAVAAVGAATHLALWTRGYWRGQLGRHRAIRRFALLSLGLHFAAFLVGNAIYPTYRIRVRAEFLEYPTAIAEDAAVRERARARSLARPTTIAPSGDEDDHSEASRHRVAAAGRAARWFDVKEHWLAMGLFASVALAWLLVRWDPRRDGLAIAPIVAMLATCVALTLWTAAIIGVVTAAWRAV